MKLKVRESEIKKAVCKYLQYQENQGKLYFIRNNVFSGFVKRKNGGQGWIQNSKKGCSDIIIFLPNNNVIFCEIKSETGKQSEEQKQFEEQIVRLGYRYCLVSNLDTLELILNDKNL